MNKTNSFRPSGRQPTPAPKTMPNSNDSAPDTSANGSLEQELAQQIESLSRLVAENNMAEVTRYAWIDLRTIKTVRYQPGKYEIILPKADDPEPTVFLHWVPGSLQLCEALQSTEENTLPLPLPTVRRALGWTVPVPTAEQVPLPPSPLSKAQRELSYLMEKWEESYARHTQAWQAHLEEWICSAEAEWNASLQEVLTDEEGVAYTGLKSIQARRINPKLRPQETISAELEAAAKEILDRTSRLDDPDEETIPE